MAQAKFRLKYPKKAKNVVDAMMEEDEHISKLLDRMSEQEAYLKLVNALASGYEDLRNAASREMTRRLGEKAPND